MSKLLTLILMVMYVALFDAAAEERKNDIANEEQKADVPPAEQKSGAAAEESVSPEKAPILVSADKVEQDSATDIIKAFGNVVIRYHTKTVKSERAVINVETGKGEASGHVVITDEGTHMTADRAEFNLKDETARSFNVLGKFKDFRVEGREIQRFSETHYQMKAATMTTCEGKIPDWLVKVDAVDLKIGDRALFKGGLFKIHDVPVLYLPVGYAPLDNTRKSGFLMPNWGSSNLDGAFMYNSYFWAIDEQRDATFYLDYMQRRGVRPGLEYRYTPSKTTAGEFRGNYLEDQLTGKNFWKVDMKHKQVLPENFRMDAKLDLVGKNNFDKTFSANTADRTRRSTDSFAFITRSWQNSNLDILTRYRSSTQETFDDVFGYLPRVTHRLQRQPIGNSPFYFNQDSSYAAIRTDLDNSIDRNNILTMHRMDWHPQVSAPFRLGGWLSVNPVAGARATYYSNGVMADNQKTNGFTREMLDFNTTIEGPRIFKTFTTPSALYPKINHIIEPRLIYFYVPTMDGADRAKIKRFDEIDASDPQNRITYALMQRLLYKKSSDDSAGFTDQLLRFEISQSYDFREADLKKSPGIPNRPFSDLRFDLNSRIIEPLMLNMQTQYNPYTSSISSWNVQLGIKPTLSTMVLLERRYIEHISTFFMGTLDVKLREGVRMQYSTRYDEKNRSFMENDLSLLYDEPCECWGVSFDMMRRNNFNNGLYQPETRFMFNVILRGFGAYGSQKGQRPMHRSF